MVQSVVRLAEWGRRPQRQAVVRVLVLVVVVVVVPPPPPLGPRLAESGRYRMPRQASLLGPRRYMGRAQKASCREVGRIKGGRPPRGERADRAFGLTRPAESGRHRMQRQASLGLTRRRKRGQDSKW